MLEKIGKDNKTKRDTNTSSSSKKYDTRNVKIRREKRTREKGERNNSVKKKVGRATVERKGSATVSNIEVERTLLAVK